MLKERAHNLITKEENFTSEIPFLAITHGWTRVMSARVLLFVKCLHCLELGFCAHPDLSLLWRCWASQYRPWTFAWSTQSFLLEKSFGLVLWSDQSKWQSLGNAAICQKLQMSGKSHERHGLSKTSGQTTGVLCRCCIEKLMWTYNAFIIWSWWWW